MIQSLSWAPQYPKFRGRRRSDRRLQPRNSCTRHKIKAASIMLTLTEPKHKSINCFWLRADGPQSKTQSQSWITFVFRCTWMHLHFHQTAVTGFQELLHILNQITLHYAWIVISFSTMCWTILIFIPLHQLQRIRDLPIWLSTPPIILSTIAWEFICIGHFLGYIELQLQVGESKLLRTVIKIQLNQFSVKFRPDGWWYAI